MEVGYRIASPFSEVQAVHYIYILFDPRDGAIRYVGRTVNPEARYRTHCRIRSERSPVMGGWIEQLAEAGVTPVMEIVAVCDAHEARAREKSFIRAADIPGSGLLNGTHCRNHPLRRPRGISYHDWAARRLSGSA